MNWQSWLALAVAAAVVAWCWRIARADRKREEKRNHLMRAKRRAF